MRPCSKAKWLPLLLALFPQMGCLLLRPHGGEASSPPHPAGKSTAALPSKESAELCMTLGESFQKKGHLAEAALQYEKAREYNPKLKDVAHRLAVIYDQLGEDQRALTEYQKALAERPKDADVYNDLGYFYYHRAKWAEAEAQLTRALEVNPKHQRAQVNLGMVLGQQQRYEDCYDAFAKVLRPAEARCNLGFILSTQGKWEDARQAYRQALELEPGLRLARFALAKLERAEAKGEPGGSKPQVSTEATP